MRYAPRPNLELYVVNEYFMTPTALMADYVLPVASWMERSYLDTIEDFADFAIGGEKAVEPLGERKEDYYLWQGLGRRLGQAEYWPWETFEEHIAERVRPMGLTYEEFVQAGAIMSPLEEKKYRKRGFPTPSGKFEIYSAKIDSYHYADCPATPQWMEPVEWLGSAKAGTYPLHLLTKHPTWRPHSSYDNVDSLRKESKIGG